MAESGWIDECLDLRAALKSVKGLLELGAIQSAIEVIDKHLVAGEGE